MSYQALFFDLFCAQTRMASARGAKRTQAQDPADTLGGDALTLNQRKCAAKKYGQRMTW